MELTTYFNRRMDSDARLSTTSVDLIEAGDINELVTHVNGLALDGDWGQLAALHAACLKAFERGKQLWPVSSYAQYRMCLDAPGPWAAKMLEAAPGRFTLGPLPEVAASRHSWAELAPHLHASPEAAMAAHERVVRGEDLRRDPVATALPEVLDLPLCLQPWEPAFPLATYHADRLEAPPPALPPLAPVPSGPPPASVGQAAPGPRGAGGIGEVEAALEELVRTWVSQSNGRAAVASSPGGAVAAISALGARPQHLGELSPGQAVAAMAWAAADGGAHGRRRGTAPGRSASWYVLAALAGRAHEWPLPADELGRAAEDARWYHWAGDEPQTGWQLRLAVELVEGDGAGRSWALSAQDHE